MHLVALDLYRAPHQMLEQDALGIAAIGERRRVIARDRRHQLRRLLDIGHELAGVGFGPQPDSAASTIGAAMICRKRRRSR